MCAPTRGADEGEVEVGILELCKVGEDLVHEKRDAVAVVIPIDRVACIAERETSLVEWCPRCDCRHRAR